MRVPGRPSGPPARQSRIARRGRPRIESSRFAGSRRGRAPGERSHFSRMKGAPVEATVQQLATLIQGIVHGDPERVVRAVLIGRQRLAAD